MATNRPSKDITQAYRMFEPPESEHLRDVVIWLREEFSRIEQAFTGSSILLNKEKGAGIKVDQQHPSFPWVDLLGPIRTRGVGATDPNDAVYRAGIRAFQFAVNDEAWLEFHIPHDHVPGSDMYLHFHWSHTSATLTGGTVTWGAEMTYSKGHDQASDSAFIAPVSLSVVGTANTTQYQHIITETQMTTSGGSASNLDTDIIEPDGLILLRAYLSSNDLTDSVSPPDPFLHFVDVHYQSTSVGTKNRSPDFWTGIHDL